MGFSLSVVIVGSLFIILTEWTYVFSIVNSSCMEDGVDFLGHKLTVNCFQKKHIEWLPQAEVGDIIIFWSLKVLSDSPYHLSTYLRYWPRPLHSTMLSMAQGIGISCTGPPMTPKTGASKSPMERMPHILRLWTGDLIICAQLADWWQAIHEKLQGITTCVLQPLWKHHLISEVILDAFPWCYFNCTVEVSL
jgi:hypothetical protein